MQFSRTLRPTLCQITTAVNSFQCFHRIFIPVTSSVNLVKGGNVDFGFQTRGLRKKIDLSRIKPLNFDYSEDLVEQEPLDPTDIVFKYRGIPELNELPDHVKKQFTLNYATSQEQLEHRNAVLLEKVTDLVGPGPCLEKEICYLTVKIRNLIPYIKIERRNKKHKSYLIERIAKRKKLMRALRKMDYDRYLWLVKELQVTCTPVDPYDYYRFTKTTKSARSKREAREDTIAEKQRKLEEIQTELNKEKEKFYKMKEKILEEIDRDIKEFGLDKVEVLKSFQKLVTEQQQEKIEESKKLTKLQRTIKEMKIKKERDSRVF